MFGLAVDITSILDSNGNRLKFDSKIKKFIHDASEYLMKAWSNYSDAVDSGKLAMSESDDFLDIEM